MKIVTGIGSREIKQPYSTWMEDVAKYLVDKKCKLRSGGATGSDTIFQTVFEFADADMEIYIPWNGFQGLYNDGKRFILANHEICKPYTVKYHPSPDYLSVGAYKLMNRNAHQVLGYDLKTPTDLIICYTKDGKIKGGTAQAIKIALDNDIPIVNIGSYKCYEELLTDVKNHIENKEKI